MMNALFPSAVLSLFSSQDAQIYKLQTPTSHTSIDVAVPFGKVIAQQSYILRACVGANTASTELKAELDGKAPLGALQVGQNCVIFDWAVALKIGTHTVKFSTGESLDSASFTFDVVAGSREEFGIVSSGRYNDWSILRQKEEDSLNYTLCSLSLAKVVDAEVAIGGSSEVLAKPEVVPHDDGICYDVNGIDLDVAPSENLELRVGLSSGRGFLFLLQTDVH